VRVLAFDTATRATTVAVLDPGGGAAIERRDDPDPGQRPRHTSRLMPLIAEVMRDSESGWPDIDLLAVGTGPGTFTGLRIGVATARALARARGIPLVGVSTLESLAAGAVPAARGGDRDVVLAVLDARRREVFAAAWPAGPGPAAWPAGPGPGDPLLAAAAMSPMALAEAAAQLGHRQLAIGDGAIEFRSVLERLGTLIPADDSGLHRVSAAVHGRLAAGRPLSGEGAVSPEYLRRPDAELTLRAPS
jgi:tRNA threonylcarbamoyladenosine biosynthesis protein TsaB